MQAAIDRIIRTLSFRHTFSLDETVSSFGSPMSGIQYAAVHDEAAAFAAELLDKYQDHLSRRSLKAD